MSVSSVVNVLAIGSLVASTLVVAQAMPLKAATPESVGPCVGGWQELPIPDGSLRATPFAVIAGRGARPWVIGGSNQGPLVLRWRDAALRRIGVAPAWRSGLLAGVETRANELLGVGFQRRTDRRLDVLVGRLSGTRWTRQQAPQPASSRAALADLVGLPTGDAWAAGTSLIRGRYGSIALERRDGRWTRRDVPLGPRGSGLLALARSPSGSLWAAGWQEVARGVLRPAILRRRSGRWARVPIDGLPAGSGVLTDMAFVSGARGWAVGYVADPSSGRHEPIVATWDGARWSRAAAPWADGMSAIPTALAVHPDGRRWTAGTQLPNGSREARGFVAHDDGSGWRIRVIDAPADVRSEMRAVAATPDGALAAGMLGATAIVVRSCAEAGPAAASGRGIRISEVRQRRRVGDVHAEEPDVVRVAARSRVQRLGRPVAPAGFTIRDVAEARGLSLTTHTYGATLADLDDDGWQDVIISRHGGSRPMLAMAGPDGFSAGPVDAFSIIDRHGCDVADVDADGRRDVLCATGRRRGSSIGRHELSLAPHSGDGALARGSLGITDPLGRGRTVAFLRLDGDAYPEVFVVNQPDREDSMPSMNRFFRNVGGRFVAAPGVGLDAPTGGHCAVGIDIDGDGDQDLLHCQRYPRDGRAPGLRVYRNDGGTLREASRALGVRPIGDVDVALGDVDGDGRRDLIQLGSGRLRVSRRTDDGFRLRYEVRISDAVAVASGDVDADGLADVYVVRRASRANTPDRLLVNAGGGRAFTSVRMPQARGGRGDDVVSLDHDRNGHDDFVVLNGWGRSGPLQLLASYPPAAGR